MGYIDWLGWAAALLTLVTFSMKTMIPLSAIAIASNIAFISYGALAEIYPVVALHSTLLPFNFIRLLQMRRLVASARIAAASGCPSTCPKSIMKLRPATYLVRSRFSRPTRAARLRRFAKVRPGSTA